MKRTAFMAALAGGLAALGLPIKLKASSHGVVTLDADLVAYRDINVWKSDGTWTATMYDTSPYGGLSLEFFQKINRDAIERGETIDAILIRFDEPAWEAYSKHLVVKPLRKVATLQVAPAAQDYFRGIAKKITSEGGLKTEINWFGLNIAIQTISSKDWDKMAQGKYAGENYWVGVRRFTHRQNYVPPTQLLGKPSFQILDSL